MHTCQNLPHQFCFASHSFFFFFLVFTADGINFFTDNPVLNYMVCNKRVFSFGAGGYILESEWKYKHSQCLLDFFFFKEKFKSK